MYLVHSPLIKNLSKQNQKIYLGNWCLNNEDKISSKHSTKVISHPFSTLKKKNEAIEYCNNFYQFALKKLSNTLNEIHGINESTKYWKIIFGSWLIRYIEIYYERYSCIYNALQLYPSIKTTLLSSENFQTPIDTLDFIYKSFEDEYNFQLYIQYFCG